MLREQELLKAWHEGKASRRFYRLEAEIAAAFEYRGPQPGHPSNYAAIRIVATPAAELCLESAAVYPASISVPYARKLLLAVGRAVVDEFFASAGDHSYRGCRLIVQEIGWDDVMSSEVAIYRAARGTLAKIRQEGTWELESQL